MSREENGQIDADLPQVRVRRKSNDDSSAELCKEDHLPDHIRVVASVPGWRECNNCQVEFYSLDWLRIRTCNRCKALAPRQVKEISTRLIGNSLLADWFE